MFAASAITFIEPLTLNCEAELKIMVADVNLKSGKTGDLVLIDIERLITQAGRSRLTERQTIVYIGRQKSAAVVPVQLPVASAHAAIWVPGTVELLRFSAVTFNAHRIHYDLPYAQAEEGYPALVVHGPLTAARLFAFARERCGAGAAPRSFRFRAYAPLFADQSVQIVAVGDRGQFDAVRCDGAVAMSAHWVSGDCESSS